MHRVLLLSVAVVLTVLTTAAAAAERQPPGLMTQTMTASADDHEDEAAFGGRRRPKAGVRYSYHGRGKFLQQNFGVGIVLGSPTGVAAKYYLDPWNAIAAAAGFWWGPRVSHLRLQADYLWHPSTLAANQDLDLRAYVGGGVKIAMVSQLKPNGGTDTYLGIGARVPVGLLAELNAVPIDVFAEIAPSAFLIPVLYPNIDFAVGARYYFR